MTRDPFEFHEKHAWRGRGGIVTNQPSPVLDLGRAHASTVCCGRPECLRLAKRWVAAETNETAVYVTDEELRSWRTGGAK